MTTQKKSSPESAPWTIEELVKTANASSGSSGSAPVYSDSRFSETLTPRNLRRLVSQGAIDPPERVGRDAFYGPKHLEQLIAAREMMSKGFSASAVSKLREADAEENPDLTPWPQSFMAQFPNPAAAVSETSSFSGSADEGSAQYLTSGPAVDFLDSLESEHSGADQPLFSSNAHGSLGASSADFSGSSRSLLSHNVGAKSFSGARRSYHSLGAKMLKSASAPSPSAESAKIFAPVFNVSSFPKVEEEALPGLWVSASALPGMGALSAEAKAKTLGALERAWAQARQISEQLNRKEKK